MGEAQEVTDASERSDEEESEDGITILVDGKLIEFYKSEIATIEKLYCEPKIIPL